MNPKVEEFLAKKKKEKEEQELKKRNSVLLKLGLCEKEYAPEGKDYSDGYTEYHYDEKEGKNIYYKSVPIEVTDEEYAEILKYASIKDTSESGKNGVATVLKIIGIVFYIVGFIGGCIAGAAYRDFDYLTALYYWVAGIISGTLFLGFAEVIKLLQEIRDK